MPDLDALQADLVRDEGQRLKPYRDTVGKLTIGIGRNLDDRGLTEDECLFLLQTDIGVTFADLDHNAPWWRYLTEPRRRALANMCFNLGWPRLSKFVNMLAALEVGNYSTAADQALDSRWAEQVGDRAMRIAELFRNA